VASWFRAGVNEDMWSPKTLLGRLSEPTRNAMLHVGTEVSFPDKELVLQQGDRNDHTYLLIRGMVKVTVHTADGAGVLLGIRIDGDTVGEMAALEGDARMATVSVCRPVVARVIPRALLENMMETHPELAREMARMISSRLRWANKRRVDISSCGPLARLSRVLVDIVESHGSEHEARGDLGVRLTQLEIASLCGLARRTVEQEFAKLISNGVVKSGYRTLEVIDMSRLRRIANGLENPH
jgi:CRP/FNR family cyclic AMP-dependent transcriptional regulator